MIKFVSVIKKISKKLNLNISFRRTAAVLLTFALLMPVAAPLPAWAYSLKIEQPIDDGLRLTASNASSTNFLGSFFGNLGAFILPNGKSEPYAETNYSKEALETKVKGFETQITDLEKVKKGQFLSLAAIPLDKNNIPVNGMETIWKSSNSEIVKVVNNSQAVALKEGEAKLTVSSGKISKEFLINVRGDMFQEIPPKNKIRNNNGATSSFVRLVDDIPVVLSEQQADSMVSPDNNLGSPVGQTEMSSVSSASAARTRERAGAANYSFGIPVASLPGRGIDASIGITYNSRVWSKSEWGGTRIFDYNIDKNWLSPGFEFSYGSIEGYSTYTGVGVNYLQTDPDGTRRQLVFKQINGNCITYESTDGTFIQTVVCGIYATPQMNVTYPDGSKITYGGITSQGKRFPIKFTDRNGNMILITYLDGDSVGKIAYIRDTLNRYITFHYDSTADKKLVAVTVPSYDNSSTPRQTIRFYYETLDIQPENRFEGPDVQVNAPDTVTVLKYVYFPGTQSGYKYDYSPYFGMIYKIWQLRGMQVSTDSLTETGNVNAASDENWAAWTHYNYPTTAMQLPPPLTDVPKYSTRKDDWKGRITGISQTNFFTEDQVTTTNGLRVGTRTTTITNPDGTKNISVTNINQSAWDDGLLKETKFVTIENEQERVWSKTKMYWVQGNNQSQGRDNPRLEKIEVTDDAGQIKVTSFGYDNYNNQTLVIERDFAPENILGNELRRTETIFETGPNWINNRLFRLPKEIKTKVNGVYVSKVVYEYDGVDLTTYGSTPIAQHDPSYTANISQEQFCYEVCPDNCSNGGNALRPCDCPLEEVCETHVFSTFYRGNVTKMTAFSDATLENDQNSVITTASYDIAGNAVTSGTNCCNLKSWTYTPTNHYAYPTSETSGDVGQLTSNINYDLNTGLVKSTTDENNQLTSFNYNPNNLRLIRTDTSNGAWSTMEYNDTSYPYYVKSTASLDSNRSGSSWNYTDGRGQGVRSRSLSINGYISNDTEFDVVGRLIKSYNSYKVLSLMDERPSEIKFTEITQRDGLGRTLQMKLPDNSFVSAAYSGLIATMTDQTGKQRRQVTDVFGRIVRIDEPDAEGNLGSINSPNQPTSYEFDGNGNLTNVLQSGSGAEQQRIFKYDSLSRLTHEKQVESIPTLDNNGNKVGESGVWTGVFKYNTKSLLIEGVDARGVKSSFTYDGLNRIKTIIYTGETSYQTPQVTYTYDQARNDSNGNQYFNKGHLTKIQTAAVANQAIPETVHTYDYDRVGQIVNHNQSIGNQSYNLQYVYNLAGQLISEKYPSGKVFNMTVDDVGRILTVSDSQRTYIGSTAYNNEGLLSQINFGNGVSETFIYNDRFQITNQTLSKGVETLQKYDYFYGQVNLATGAIDETKNNGQLAKIESFIGLNKQWSQRFGYDELERLSETREYKFGDNSQLTYKQKFNFDRFGNLYRKTSSNSTNEQQNPLPYTPIEDADINKSNNRFTTGTVYDESGQVVTDSKFRNMGFSYDANGRQIRATKANTPDALSVYDGLGNRVATKIYNVWQNLIYDAFGKLVAEYGVSSEGTGGVKFVQQDWQGSIRTVTNSNGFVTARIDHQAFGEDIGLGVGLRSIEQGYSADKITRQGYGLTENDESSGQKHTWWRKLETQAGRWTRPDPYKGSMSLVNPQTFNRYSYVANNPINAVDPSGLDIWDDLRKALTMGAQYAQGMAAARDALQSSLCRNFLKRGGSYPKSDPRQVFQSYQDNKNITIGKKYRIGNDEKSFRNNNVGAVTVAGQGTAVNGVSASMITINMNGTFFSLKTTGGTNLNTFSQYKGLSDGEIRGSQIIHELAHAFGAIPSDGTDDQQSMTNSSTVKTFCFSPLAKLFRDREEPIQIEPGTIGTEITPRQYIGYNSGYPWWMWSLQAFLAELSQLGNEGTVTVCYNGQCS